MRQASPVREQSPIKASREPAACRRRRLADSGIQRSPDRPQAARVELRDPPPWSRDDVRAESVGKPGEGRRLRERAGRDEDWHLTSFPSRADGLVVSAQCALGDRLIHFRPHVPGHLVGQNLFGSALDPVENLAHHV